MGTGRCHRQGYGRGPRAEELQACHRAVALRTPDTPASIMAFGASRLEAPCSFVEWHPGRAPPQGVAPSWIGLDSGGGGLAVSTLRP